MSQPSSPKTNQLFSPLNRSAINSSQSILSNKSGKEMINLREKPIITDLEKSFEGVLTK